MWEGFEAEVDCLWNVLARLYFNNIHFKYIMKQCSINEGELKIRLKVYKCKKKKN